MNLWENLQNANKNLKTKKQDSTQTAYIDGEDTQSSRPDENQVRVAGTNDVRSSIDYVVKLQTNPPRKSFRVLEAEMAKSTQLVGTPAHTEMPTIANFGNVIVSQDSSDCQMQGNLDSADSKSVKKAVNGEAVRSLHTPSESWMGGNDKSFGANALSLTADETMPQNPTDCQMQGNNESSLVGIVNSDTLTQDEMDELAQNALLANLDEKHNDDKLQLIVGASNPHTSRPAELNASNETLLGANAHLPTDNETISQNPSDCQTQGNLDSLDSDNKSMKFTHKRCK